jgi:2-methylisocitrate lyase-like PEP mutase family enzyme
MGLEFRKQLKQELAEKGIIPFIGVYDVFSASIAAKHYNSIFLSGFGFAASFYGLPDIGFITWSDMIAYVQRVRTVLPRHLLLVDMDDGYGDADIACHVMGLLESVGASGVVIEDQRRPRRCGHFDGKQLLTIDEFLDKLTRVLETRKEMFVVARTDAVDPDDILERAKAFAHAGADAVLVDGIGDLALIKELKRHIDLPIVFNQIAGGKSRIFNLNELETAGISMVIYSTPCLFPAQAAVEKAVISLRENGGLINSEDNSQIDLEKCANHLRENQSRRNIIES